MVLSAFGFLGGELWEINNAGVVQTVTQNDGMGVIWGLLLLILGMVFVSITVLDFRNYRANVTSGATA